MYRDGNPHNTVATGFEGTSSRFFKQHSNLLDFFSTSFSDLTSFNTSNDIGAYAEMYALVRPGADSKLGLTMVSL